VSLPIGVTARFQDSGHQMTATLWQSPICGRPDREGAPLQPDVHVVRADDLGDRTLQTSGLQRSKAASAQDAVVVDLAHHLFAPLQN
jgi:hypothetical protein